MLFVTVVYIKKLSELLQFWNYSEFDEIKVTTQVHQTHCKMKFEELFTLAKLVTSVII